MDYLLPQHIKEIRKFYEDGKGYYVVIVPQVARGLSLMSDPTLQAQSVDTQTENLKFLLRKTVPIMLCMVWQGFSKEIESNESSKYTKHFSVYSTYYNEPIREVSLLRNCIVHCNGKIDQDYLDKATLKTFGFNVLDEQIDFDELQLETMFKIFEDAYNFIKSN